MKEQAYFLQSKLKRAKAKEKNIFDLKASCSHYIQSCKIIRQEDMCELLGISRSGLNKRFSNPGLWNLEDLEVLIKKIKDSD